MDWGETIWDDHNKVATTKDASNKTYFIWWLSFGATMISNEMHAATFAPPQQQYAVTENTSFYDNDDDRDSNPDMFEAFDLDLDE